MPFSAIGGNPANAGVARLCGVSPHPIPDTTTALPNVAPYQLSHTRIFNFCHDTTARGKNKDFSVCGHLCGQSRFYTAFGNRGKSRKRRCYKALRRFASPYPGYNHGTPKLCAATLLTIPAFYAFCKRGKRCGWVKFVGLQYILNKSITQDMACRQSNEVRGEIRREPCQPEI